MEERDFLDEKSEQRKIHTMMCPHCGQHGEYEVGLAGAAQEGAGAAWS